MAQSGAATWQAGNAQGQPVNNFEKKNSWRVRQIWRTTPTIATVIYHWRNLLATPLKLAERIYIYIYIYITIQTKNGESVGI
jgi:hypothetical protein